MKNTIPGNKKLMLTTAILLELSVQSMSVNAATIIVDQNTCDLAAAITAANSDTSTLGCAAGSGDDVLILDSNINITLNQALPIVNSTISMEGNGAHIERNSVSEFRLIDVQNGTLTMNNITLSGGTSPNTGYSDDYGAGIRVSAGNLNLNNVIVRDNLGIGVAVVNNSMATINNSRIFANTGLPTYFSGGGGLHISGSQALVNDSDISNNQNISAGIGGGGVYISNRGGSSVVDINRTSITNNSSNRSGGGINAITGGSGEDTITLSLKNSTISGNTASENGGGIHCNLINASIISSTITDNTASGYGAYQGRGGGISCGIGFPPAGSVISIEQSIVSGNVAGIGSEINDSSSVFSYGYNIIGQLNSSGIEGSMMPSESDAVPAVGIAAIVDVLADHSSKNNKGLSHQLVSDSPAIDWVDGHIDCVGQDQNGVDRPLDGDQSSTNECDAGATEYLNDIIFKDGFE